MKNKLINNKIETFVLYFILEIAIFLLNIKQLSFLSLIIGNILAFFYILIFEHLNLREIKIVKYLIFPIIFFSTIFFLNKTTYFVSDNVLRNYSNITISITLIITILWITNKGYQTIIKITELASYFLIFILIIGFILVFSYIKLENLETFSLFSNNLFLDSLSYSLMLFYPYLLISPLLNKKLEKKIMITTSLSQIFLYVLIISILSQTLTNLYQYPFLAILKKVSLIGFIDRIEIIFSLLYLFIFYFLLLFSFYQLKYILENKIKKEKTLKIILSFLAIIIFISSFIVL